MFYSLAILWQDRQRYLPGILAVAFSALLIALQGGLLRGLFSITSIPIDHTRAHVWVCGPDVPSVDVASKIPESWLSRLENMPEVERAEIYLQGFSYWTKPTGGMELCMVIGSRLDDDALGYVRELTPELRQKLTEPGAIVMDESDRERLGIKQVGDMAEIIGHRVRVVGMIKGVRGLAAPFIFGSIDTARPLLRMPADQVTYLLARCRRPEDAARVAKSLNDPLNLKQTAFTSENFSVKSQIYWLTKTKAGVAMGFAALLGLLVGAVVTSQTLFSAMQASQREFAVLRALGIPRWRMGALVVAQSLGIGLFGIAVALPTIFGLAYLSQYTEAHILLADWLIALTVAVTLAMAGLSGLTALRSLRGIDPAILLR